MLVTLYYTWAWLQQEIPLIHVSQPCGWSWAYNPQHPLSGRWSLTVRQKGGVSITSFYWRANSTQMVRDSMASAAPAANKDLGSGSMPGTCVTSSTKKALQVQTTARVWSWFLLSTMRTILQIKHMLLWPTFSFPSNNLAVCPQNWSERSITFKSFYFKMGLLNTGDINMSTVKKNQRTQITCES